MYARVTYVQSPEGKVMEGLQLWRQNVLPVTMGREGFRGVLSLVNQKTGQGIAVTLWELEETMMASTEAEYHLKAVERFGEFFENAHEPDNFLVDYYNGPAFEAEFQEPETLPSKAAS